MSARGSSGLPRLGSSRRGESSAATRTAASRAARASRAATFSRCSGNPSQQIVLLRHLMPHQLLDVTNAQAANTSPAHEAAIAAC